MLSRYRHYCCRSWLVLLCGWILPSMAQNTVPEPLLSIKPLALLHAQLRPQAAAKVRVLIPPARDLHDYVLSASDMRQLQQAPLLLWLGRASEPFIAPLQARLQGAHTWQALDHQHPHPWLDNAQTLQLSVAMAQALQQVYPQEKNAIIAQQRQFAVDLATRKNYWRQRFAPFAQQPLLLGHDALANFAQDMGLQQVVLYRASGGHGHVQSGMQELLAVQQRIQRGEIRCAIEEPDISFASLQQRYPTLRTTRIQPMGDSIALAPHAYWAFIDSTARRVLQCLSGESVKAK